VKKNTIQKGLCITLVLLLALVLFFSIIVVAMQFNVNPLVDEMCDAMQSPVFYVSEDMYNLYAGEFPEKYKDPNITYVIYHEGDGNNLLYTHYSPRQSLPVSVKFEDCVFEIEVQQLFAWHNFSRGFLWVKYTRQTILPDGKIFNGGYGIVVKLTIEKRGENWITTDICDPP
jgi:hypothetical protein